MRVDQDDSLEDYDPVIPMFVDPEEDDTTYGDDEYNQEDVQEDVIPELVGSGDDGVVDDILEESDEDTNVVGGAL